MEFEDHSEPLTQGKPSYPGGNQGPDGGPQACEAGLGSSLGRKVIQSQSLIFVSFKVPP